jgi:hypothetical protein
MPKNTGLLILAFQYSGNHVMFSNGLALSAIKRNHYKILYPRAEEGRKKKTERRRQETERRRQAEECNQQTSFTELLQHRHVLLSRQLRTKPPFRSTTGKIPLLLRLQIDSKDRNG